jgi:hypothetical protein
MGVNWEVPSGQSVFEPTSIGPCRDAYRTFRTTEYFPLAREILPSVNLSDELMLLYASYTHHSIRKREGNRSVDEELS